MVIEMANRSMQYPKGIVENVMVKIHKFIFSINFVILDIIEDKKVPIILGRPMLATAHARINVFRGKIALEVGNEQIIFNANEGATPAAVSYVCVIKDHDVIDEFGGPVDLEELLMNDDINGDLGTFLHDNDLLLDFDDQGTTPLSPKRSRGNSQIPVGEFQDSKDNMGIGIDDFVAIDDLWDKLDLGALTNEQPLKPEFLSVGNRVHRHNSYNLQITRKIGFVNFNPYIDTHSPFNVISRASYNFIIKRELVYTGNNMVGLARNLHVFFECHTFLTDFIILENINEFVEKGLTEVLFGKSFKVNVGLEEDINKGVLCFKIGDDKTIFNMPRAERRLNKRR
nr:hypothetical protein [Tanacetum cinerariifolium]